MEDLHLYYNSLTGVYIMWSSWHDDDEHDVDEHDADEHYDDGANIIIDDDVSFVCISCIIFYDLAPNCCCMMLMFFVGSIPSSISSLSALRYFDLQTNRLTGEMT